MMTRAEFEAEHPEPHDTIVCDRDWYAVPVGCARNITRTERSDMCRWWRDEFIATLTDEQRANWDARVAIHVAAQEAAKKPETRCLFTDDKWTVFAAFVAANNISLPPVGLDLLAFVENG